jgi:SprT protein
MGKAIIDKNTAKQEINEKLKQCIAELEQSLDVEVMPHEIKFDLRGACAGQVAYIPGRRGATLRFNLALATENWPDYRERTVPHEVAHLAVASKYGIRKVRPHGPEWQQAMLILGLEPKRCHSYDVSKHKRSRPRPHIYSCECQQHRVSQNIHNKIQAGQKRYCRKCKKFVVLTGIDKTGDKKTW